MNRALIGHGTTGNFLVDPDWEEWQFRELWDLVASITSPDPVERDGSMLFATSTPPGGSWRFAPLRFARTPPDGSSNP